MYGIVILAAGNSSRLGEPKQLLCYENKTLIRRIAEAAASVANVTLVVVTGYDAGQITAELESVTYSPAHNADWPTGMASSVRSGLSQLLLVNPAVESVILAVSDQPFATTTLFEMLISKANETNSGIVASAYADTLGTPVLFTKKYFDALLSLTGTEGAKKLLKKFENDVSSVPFPSGAIDIDTKQDYQKLLNNGSKS
jgi:molybdenum cofactor cytidylyltransferase